MPGKIHRFIAGGYGSAVLWSALLSLILPAAEISTAGAALPDSLYSLAQQRLAAAKVPAAFTLLDSALELDPKHGPSLIARGRLNLKLGELNSAREDFTRASFHEVDSIRSAGFLGRGDVYRRLRFRNLRAVAEYRKALQADRGNLEALYNLAQTGFDLKETQGYRMASKALTRLVVADPLYRDAYRLWREKILDHTEKELHQVGRRLDSLLSQLPDTAGWRLDLAGDCFKLGRTEEAMARLAEIESSDPGYKPWVWYLLRARCRLDSGDTTGFESDYFRSLEEAGRSGHFEELFRQAEPIFTPGESEKWATLDSARQMADFFRTFWAERDPDPLTSHNERLITHYLRLREAEKKYFIFFPHSRFQTSRTYNRLLSPVTFFQDYDPELFWNRCRPLLLDHRGLLFMRHGPPDRVTRQVTWANPMEIWYYGPVRFLFERKRGAGDFIYTPGIGRGRGDINQAMQTESFVDPVPRFDQDYYVADFLAPDGRNLEIEFYQSSSLELGPSDENPLAAVAIFDSTWRELARNEEPAAASPQPEDSLWLSVHRLTSSPGVYNYVIRMQAPQRRAVDRGNLVLEPYPARKLALSGIILGGPLPESGRGFHRRGNVELMPRPSRRFRRGETVQIFLEVYGVRSAWTGERSFREKVTVSRLGRKPKADRDLWEVIELFNSEKGGRQRISLTLTFNRTLDESAGRHAENFTLDTRSLAAGYYRLLIDVRDNSSGRRSRKDAFFEIVEPAK